MMDDIHDSDCVGVETLGRPLATAEKILKRTEEMRRIGL